MVFPLRVHITLCTMYLRFISHHPHPPPLLFIGILQQPQLNGKLMVIKELPTPERASYLVSAIGTDHDPIAVPTPTSSTTPYSPQSPISVYGMKVEKLMLVVPVQERIDGVG